MGTSRRRAGLVLCLLGLAGCQAASTGAVEGASAQALTTVPGYRSLLVRWSPRGIELVNQRWVAGPLQRVKSPLPGAWKLDLLDAAGAVRFTTRLEAPNVVRAEGLSGETPALVRRDEASFLVNVPWDAEATTVRVWAQQWTLSDASPASEAWVMVGEVPVAGGPR